MKMSMDSMMASPPPIPTASSILGFGLPSALDLAPFSMGSSNNPGPSSSIATSTPMMGKLRHYKKELMYNSLLRPHVTEVSPAMAHSQPSTSRSESINPFASNFGSSMSSDMSSFFNPASMFSQASNLTSPVMPSLSTSGWSSNSSNLANYRAAAAAGLLSPTDLLIKIQEQALASVNELKAPEPSIFNPQSFSSPTYASGSASSSTATHTTIPCFSMSPPPPPPPPQIMPDQMPTHVGRKPLNGPPCSLKILVDDNILEPAPGSLSYDVMVSNL